jgi:hypothetical protein
MVNGGPARVMEFVHRLVFQNEHSVLEVGSVSFLRREGRQIPIECLFTYSHEEGNG